MLEIYFYAGRLDMEDLGRRVSIVHAEVDKISALYEYKNDAKPHFLFYVVRSSIRPKRARARSAHVITPLTLTYPCHLPLSQRGELIASVKGPQLPQIQSLIREHAQPPATPAAC